MTSLRPTFVTRTVETLTPEIAKQNAIDTIAFDVDGTLSDYHAPEIEPTVERTLESLGEAGLSLFIISNAYGERAADLVNIYSGLLPEAHIITPVSVAPAGERLSKYRKPHATMLLHAISLASSEPAHTLMVGDQLLKDVLSANLAGAQSLLVPRRGTNDHLGVYPQRAVEAAIRPVLGMPALANRLRDTFPGEITRV